MRQNNKIIHYFLEGDLGFSYENSWKEFAGDYTFKKWDNSNTPNIPELRPYREKKQWSVLSDFIRRWAILEFGGIYLDYDVQLLWTIDDLLELESFVCIEGYPIFPNAAVSGGFKGNKFHGKLLEDYMDVITGKRKYPSRIEVACSPWVLRDFVQDHFGRPMDESFLNTRQEKDGFVTLPKHAFFPYNWNEEFAKECIKPETYGIHWWAAAWK